MDGASSSGEAPLKADISCLVCRSRKVRCDRSLPSCNACARLGVTCPQYDRDSEFISRKDMQRSADDIFRAAGVEKRRVGSCQECRTSKHRCTQTRPSCRRCVLRNVPCIYPDKVDRARSLPVRQPGPPSPKTEDPFQPPPRPPNIAAGFDYDIDSLYSDTLPDDYDLRLRLINSFFKRTYPTRGLNFIHKLSFMHSLERASVVQDYSEPLLYMICALGARHLYDDDAVNVGGTGSMAGMSIPGHAWAERARKEVLSEIHSPNIHHIMTLVLAVEYSLREDKNAMPFILVAILHRMVSLLGIDDPKSLDPSVGPTDIIQQEVENRLFWACYGVDRLLETGVKKNSCWQDTVPDVPLPCSEDDFALGVLSKPVFLQEAEEADASVARNMDYPALSLLLLRIRARTLQVVRMSDMAVSEPTSEFVQIIQRLEALYQNFPDRFLLTDETIPVLREQNIMGGVVGMHLLVHAGFFDLTRVSLAGFCFPLAACFKMVSVEFRQSIQDLCRLHSSYVSQLIRQEPQLGRAAFDDIFSGDIAFESAKIQIIYNATVNQSPQVSQITRENLFANLSYLRTVKRGKDTAVQFVRKLLPLCVLFGFRDITEKYNEQHSADQDVEVTGSADFHHLGAFAPFRRARSELQGSRSGGSSSKTASSGSAQPSPAMQSTHPSPANAPASPGTASMWEGYPMASTPGQRSASTATASTLMTTTTYAPTPPPPFPPSVAANMGMAMGAASLQTIPQRNPLQLMPSAGVMVQSGAILQPSVDDYIKTADFMADYLTWNMPSAQDLPPWLNFC